MGKAEATRRMHDAALAPCASLSRWHLPIPPPVSRRPITIVVTCGAASPSQPYHRRSRWWSKGDRGHTRERGPSAWARSVRLPARHRRRFWLGHLLPSAAAGLCTSSLLWWGMNCLLLMKWKSGGVDQGSVPVLPRGGSVCGCGGCHGAGPLLLLLGLLSRHRLCPTHPETH